MVMLASPAVRDLGAGADAATTFSKNSPLSVTAFLPATGDKAVEEALTEVQWGCGCQQTVQVKMRGAQDGCGARGEGLRLG